MKSWKVHYENKYPGGMVIVRDDSMDVYCKEGKHRVALRKNGAGQWQCVSEELGCQDRHDLSPIPKNARFMKLHKDGRIGQAEEHSERKAIAEALAAHAIGGAGKVPSLEELEAAGAKLKSSPKGDHDRSWEPAPSA